MGGALLVGAVLTCVGMFAACDDDEPAAAPSTTVGTAAAPSTTVETADATATTASEGPATFESTQYPFALRLPAGVEEGSWADARQRWDGVHGIDMAGPFLDVVFLGERSLFLLGAPTSDDLDAFVASFAGNATQRHGCSEPQNRREVTIGGDPAVGFTQHCDEDVVQARVGLVHDGFGFFAFSQTVAGEEDAALDEVIAALDGLEWRTG